MEAGRHTPPSATGPSMRRAAQARASSQVQDGTNMATNHVGTNMATNHVGRIFGSISVGRLRGIS